MGKDSVLRNRLKAVRSRLGISQQDLATAAGVARQTIGGIESETYALSLTVALHLAKALGCAVEELFWLEDHLPTVEASVIGTGDFQPGPGPVRVALFQVGGRWLASPLVGEAAFRREMVPADGIGTWDSRKQVCSVRLLDAPDVLAQTVLLAGCTPALSLWARSAEQWHPGLRVRWLHANSSAALDFLARGDIPIAGVHLFDLRTGEDNEAFVRKAMRGTPAVLVNLGTWEEGFLVAPGNPQNLTGVKDLTRKGIRFVNRDEGAGARLLLDALLEQEGIAPSGVTGYENVVLSHQDVASAVQSGRADVGVSTAGVATTYGLDFIPLRTVRYDLALRHQSLQSTAVQQLLGTLQHQRVLSQLATLGGYDTTHTGEVTEVN